MTLATLAKKQIAAEKRVSSVVIVARYTFKDEARKAYSVYVVRSSDGTTTYTCTLVNGKTTGCDCPARKPCKHGAACERAEQKILAQKAAHAAQMAEAEQVAPLVLGAFAEDLPAHIDDEIASQGMPVAVWDGEGSYAYVLVDGLVEPVYGGSLNYYYPKHIVGEPMVYGPEVQRRLDEKLVVERMSYRDLYPADFN